MSASLCPYCRGTIDSAVEEPKICPGCATPHHADCFEENGGCTVFGCSVAPAEEPKLSLSATDLAATLPTPNPTAPRIAASTPSSTLHLEPLTPQLSPAPIAPPIRVKAPPPPMPDSAPAGVVPNPAPIPRFGTGSILFGVQPVAAAAVSAPATDFDFDFEDSPEAKNRISFIVLGVLLGMFGAHNFYAGFTKKAIAQLCITLLSVGFASPMVWLWAVIDVCTVFRDSKGLKFKA